MRVSTYIKPIATFTRLEKLGNVAYKESNTNLNNLYWMSILTYLKEGNQEMLDCALGTAMGKHFYNDYLKAKEYFKRKEETMSIVYCKCGKIADGNDWLCKTHYASEHFKRGDYVTSKKEPSLGRLEIIEVCEDELYPYWKMLTEKGQTITIPFDKAKEIELLPRIAEIEEHIEFVESVLGFAAHISLPNEKRYRNLLRFLYEIKGTENETIN